MSATEVFGKPVEGEVGQYGDEPVKQADPEQLREALDYLFELPNVQAVRWQQYTPYFNDGEACEFGIYEANVLVDGAPEDGGDYGDGFIDSWAFKYHKNDDWMQKIDNIEEVVARLNRVSSEVGGGQHYVFLKQSFGDPAEVTATREGFSIEFYDHD